MPNIDADLQAILDAQYGRDVRGSIHDAIRDINTVVDGNVGTVTALTERAETAAGTSENKALVAEGFAKGTQNGEAVGSGSPYYHNNAEYFKNQAAVFDPSLYLSTADVVNSLTSTATDAPLSAYQGNVLDTAKQPKTLASPLTISGAQQTTVEGALGALNNTLIFANVTVATSAFTADATYSDYGYKADITLAGVTSDYVPTVNFDVDEADSGKYAPAAASGSGKVTIYASEVPAAAITIPSIVCQK